MNDRRLPTERFLLLVRQLAADPEIRSQAAAARFLGIDPSYLVKLRGEPHRNVGMEAIDKAVAKLRLDRRFFDIDLDDEPDHRDYLGAEPHVELDRDVPPSYLAWKATQKHVDPEVERRMLARRYAFPPDEAWRWGQVHDLEVADMRGRTVGSSVRAQDEETERAQEELRRLRGRDASDR